MEWEYNVGDRFKFEDLPNDLNNEGVVTHRGGFLLSIPQQIDEEGVVTHRGRLPFCFNRVHYNVSFVSKSTGETVTHTVSESYLKGIGLVEIASGFPRQATESYDGDPGTLPLPAEEPQT